MRDPTSWTLLDLAAIAIRGRRVALGVPLVVGALVGVTLLMLPRQWTVAVLLQPEGGGGELGGLAGIAAQFGVRVPTGGATGESPAFYVELLGTRALLEPVAVGAYTAAVEGVPRTAPLAEWLHVRYQEPGLRTEQVIVKLRRRVGASELLESGLVQVRVRTRWPALSYAIAESLLASLQDFNVNQRRSRARAERDFLADRLRVVEAEVRDAEAAMAEFLSRNRQYERDPGLQFAYQRLDRDVSTGRDVAAAVRQAYEQVRIDEVRETPEVTVVQPPVLPVSPDRRRLIARAGGVAFVAFFIAVVMLWIQAAWRARSQDP